MNEDFLVGATARNRTADILITSEVLCRLSYGGFPQGVILKYRLPVLKCLPVFDLSLSSSNPPFILYPCPFTNKSPVLPILGSTRLL
jgi:hypothetical protein